MTNHPSNTLDRIPLVTVQPRKLNERLWELEAIRLSVGLSALQRREQDCIANSLETEQDDWLVIERLPCGGVVL